MKHRMYLLGLLVLTVVGLGAASPSLLAAPAQALFAARAFVVGVLVLLWTYWLRAEKRQS